MSKQFDLPLLPTTVVGSHGKTSWWAAGVRLFEEEGKWGPFDIDEMLGCAVDMAIRAAGTVAMGIAPDAATATAQSPAVPKIALVASPRAYVDLSGEPVSAEAADLNVLIVSMGKIHRAVALTGAMCLAVAAHLDGTVVQEVARAPASRPGGFSPGRDVRIGHPSGVLPLAARVRDGVAEKVVVYRTARRLFEGYVRVPQRAIDDPAYLRERAATRAAVVAD